MADRVRIDAHEVVGLVDAIDKASRPKLADVTAVVAKGAVNIKKDAARRISGLAHAPAYPRSIGYDLYQSLRGPSAIIGPDKSKPQGALGNLLEYGSIKNPPHPHFGPAGDAEEPKFGAALEALAVKTLGLE
jgi:hypothetical protein